MTLHLSQPEPVDSLGTDLPDPPARITLPTVRPEGLTARETEVVDLIARGLTNDEIAERLYITRNTVKTIIRHAYRKMRVERRSQAVLWALRHGLGAS